jgi:hypothetical protein
MIETTTPAEAPSVQPSVVEPITPMKVSEILRLGSLSTTQAFGRMVDNDGRMCALGVVWHALGWDGTPFVAFDTALLRGVHADPPSSCDDVPPMSNSEYRWPITSMIVHLNDQHQWSFTQIADWLEGQGL